MPATETLASTTLSASLGASGGRVSLASMAGILPGMRLYVEGELMAVILCNGECSVTRGVDGTASVAHTSGATVYFGRADQFYQGPPMGAPPAAVLVSP